MSMRTFILTLIVFVCSIFSLEAQTRYAFVDTDFILDNIPEYQSVKTQLETISKKWQNELDKKYSIVDSLNTKFRLDQVFLSESMKNSRKKEINKQKRELKKLEDFYFGNKGELYKKKQELLKPILDEVYEAIKAVALRGNYGAIYDRAAGLNVIYFNPKLEKSKEVLSRLGYKIK